MIVFLNGMLNHSKSRLSGVVRTISTTSRIHANHYDVLGITPKATQADIKSAYYKLSKIYHPDKSNDEESAKKFRAITEAYEVLGNIKLKKMYDKGLLVGTENTSRMSGTYRQEPEPVDPTLKFYKSRGQRHVAPTMDGRTPIYDFDEWAKNHYGDLLKKSKADKDFIKHKIDKARDYNNSVQQELTIYISAFLCILFFGLVTYGKSEFDIDNVPKENAQTNIQTNKSDKS